MTRHGTAWTDLDFRPAPPGWRSATATPVGDLCHRCADRLPPGRYARPPKPVRKEAS